jgi:hypothetical protein
MPLRPVSLLCAFLAAGMLIAARDGGELPISRASALPAETLLAANRTHRLIIVHPRRVLPSIGVTSVPVKPPRAPSPYLCPGASFPNLPCGTPITNSPPGYTSCTFINGRDWGCDVYPMPTGSAVGGQQPGGHNQHHID